MILVTGSSGTVGKELLKELTAAGESVRAGQRTRPPSTPGVHGVRIDLATGEGLDAAVTGADAVFLLVGGVDDQTTAEIRVVEAAQRAGVKRLVKLSVLCGPEPLTYAQAAAKLSAAVGRTISYVDVSERDFKKSMTDMGAPGAYVDALLELSAFSRRDERPCPARPSRT